MRIHGFSSDLVRFKEGTMLSGMDACVKGPAFYRVFQPLQFLKQKGNHEVDMNAAFIKYAVNAMGKTEVKIPMGIMNNSDVVIFQQQKLHSAIDPFQWSQVFRDFSSVLVYDCDDNYHLASKSGSPEKMYKDPNIKHILSEVERFIGYCDVLTVTTEELKNAYSKYNSRTVVLPNCINLDLIEDAKQNYWRRRYKTDEIIIGWAGSPSHKWDLEPLIPVIRKIRDEFQNTRFVFIGYIPPELKDEERIDFIEPTWESKFPVTAYYGRIAEAGFDIAMIPILRSPFNRYKSPLKFLEMSSFGIPSIVDNQLPYSPYINHLNKEWCLTVNSKSYEWNRFTEKLMAADDLRSYQEEWYEKLRGLIISQKLRKSLSSSAYEFVWRYFSMENCWKVYERLYQSLVDIKRKYFVEEGCSSVVG